MAELVDALDLGSSGVIHGGSSPFTRTTEHITGFPVFFMTAREKLQKVKSEGIKEAEKI